MFSQRFDGMATGPQKTALEGNEWYYVHEGSLEFTREGGFSGVALRGNGRWGGGINVLTDGAVETGAIYEIHLRARVEDAGRPLEFWSNCV